MLSSAAVSDDRPSIVVKGEGWRICPECGVRLQARRCPKCKTTSVPALLLEGGSVAEPTVGMVLSDQYELQEQLGEGGMGKVYKAMQLSMDREVAVKIISREISSDLDSIRRFQREAKVTSRLSHPHSIRVFDFGISDEGLFYLAMELLRGKELAVEILDRGALQLVRALDLSLQVLHALQEAHGLGIVHRDLKPTNIFLRDIVGEGDFVKVMDFGIAKASFAEEYQRVTQTGTIVGTPKYMAPEQARGLQADARSDIYAMGIILHEMLTGRAPFEHESPVQVLLKHTMEPLPRLAELRPDLVDVRRVQSLIDLLCAKDPAHRPSTVAEAATEIQALRDSLGQSPRQDDEPGVDALTIQADVVPSVTPPYLALPEGDDRRGGPAADEVETGPVDLPDAVSQAESPTRVDDGLELPGGFAERSGDRATFVGVAIPVPQAPEDVEPVEEEDERATVAFSTSAVQQRVASSAEPAAATPEEPTPEEPAPEPEPIAEAVKKTPPKPAIVVDPQRIRPLPIVSVKEAALAAVDAEAAALAHESKTVVLDVPAALDMASRETVAIDVAKVNAASQDTVVERAPTSTSHQRSRWPFAVAALLLIVAVGGAVAYGSMGDSDSGPAVERPSAVETDPATPAATPSPAPDPPPVAQEQAAPAAIAAEDVTAAEQEADAGGAAPSTDTGSLAPVDAGAMDAAGATAEQVAVRAIARTIKLNQ